MNTHLVFAYGTLKTGEPNNFHLHDKSNGCAEYVGKGKTFKKWPLVITSKYNIPFLLDKPDFGHNIVGEVYKVDDQMLGFLDEFECHPTYYLRKQEKVILDNGTELEPWIYFLTDFQKYMLDLPTHQDYSSKGPHGLRYVERWERDQSVDGSLEKNDVTHQVKLFSQ